MILVVIVLVLIGVMATYALSRISGAGTEASTVTARLDTAVRALEAYAATSQRLPCPADPLADTGAEVKLTASTCTYADGTLPWLTIGMKREDAYDPWGRKLSYRVYTNSPTGNGSLTQDGGASMVYCDTNEPTATGNTDANGLCVNTGTPESRSTKTDKFLAGKGFTLSDMGTTYTDVAFVVMSHGPTGLGGYTVSGARLDLPAGDERNNTKAGGSFTIKAFSDVDTAATVGTHYDDYLAYRRLPDLIRRTNLVARDWPESAASPPPLFNATNVAASLGISTSDLTTGNTGQASLNFSGMQVSGGSSAQLSYVADGGVSANGGLGIAGGGSDLIQSSASEFLRLDLTSSATDLGVTLGDFGYYGSLYFELVEFRFYLDGVPVTNVLAIACNQEGLTSPSGGMASFSMSVGAPFNQVEIAAFPAYELFSGTYSGITAFLVSEVAVCTTSSPACRTSLDATANRCT